MVRKEARGKAPRKSHWKGRITVAISVVVVVGVCLALRPFSGAQDAKAEAPVLNGVAPAHRTSAATTQTPQSVAPAPQTPKLVATVNGEQISRQELAEECLRRYGAEVLESVVNKHLIWQACQAKGIQITDQDVEAEINRLAGKFGLSPSRWLTMLHEERDIAPEQYRREIIWPTLALRALAAKELVVTPDEMKKAWEVEYGPRVKVRAITVSSRESAEQLRAAAAANPENFGDLAKKHSEDQSASVNGLIPPIRKNVGDENIERVAFGLQEGEISPVIQVANQYVILKCEKQLEGTYIAERFRQDAEDRIRDRVQEQKLRGAAASLFQQLQQDARVVNVMNDPELQKQMPGVAATINDQKISVQQLAEECIERHGRDVLDGEINRKILLQALKRKSQQVAEQDLDQEIARAADAYGFLKPDGTPDIEKWLGEVTKEEGATVELYVRDAVWPTVALKKLVDNHVQVTDDDIQKGFVSNYGPRVEALAIVMNNQRQAQKVWEMARDNPTDQFFGELAHQYSVDSVSRENYGRIPPIRQHGGRPELEKEAFALKPGELSGIIASDENYIILRCTGFTTPVVGSLDNEVRQELVKDIREKKLRLAMSIEFERLQKAAEIENLLTGSFQSAANPNTGERTTARPVAANQPRR